MIDFSTLDNKTKAALVCLYYAQLESDDVRYKNKCHDSLKLVSQKFGFKYGNLKNDKDAFDALYPNGRKGWTDRPLEKRSAFLHSIHEQYNHLTLDELETIANNIIEESSQETLSFFSIKTKDPSTVENILNRNYNIVFDGLNILKDSLKQGQPLFIVLGGDKPNWETGLIGMGIISKEPYDDGYDSKKTKNFKVNVDIQLLLDKPIKREDLIPYKDTYGIIGIAPIIKWEPNQAISQVNEKNAIALMRAMLELSPSIDNDLQKIINPEVYQRIKGATTKMMPVEVDFGEKLPTEIEQDEDSIDESMAVTPYTKEDFLSEVFIDEDSYDTICKLLNYKKNIILEGSPGVGKTFAAKRLAYSILGFKSNKNINMLQFHQSYSYEDFIMGFKPTQTGFELSHGPFYDFCIKAKSTSEKQFFIIDEINRGNLSKIFGELLMLIESDKRDESVTILYKNEEFSIPNNVYIIGMMNTADRSLAIMDYALRRRFSFYRMDPAFNSVGFNKLISESKTTKFGKVIDVVKDLNTYISNDESLGNGFQIGHSYFCFDTPATDDLLSMVIEYEIIPLLNEYWFDENDKVSKWSKKLRGALDD